MRLTLSAGSRPKSAIDVTADKGDVALSISHEASWAPACDDGASLLAAIFGTSARILEIMTSAHRGSSLFRHLTRSSLAAGADKRYMR